MVRRARLKKRLRARRKPRLGYWQIEKTGELPPQEILQRLKLRPLDYGKYARTKNGGS